MTCTATPSARKRCRKAEVQSRAYRYPMSSHGTLEPTLQLTDYSFKRPSDPS